MRWKVIDLCPEYEVSEYGDVRRVTTVGYRKAGALLKPWVHPKGYLRFELWSGGKKIRRGAHQLVALAFIGPQPSPEHEVAHNDGHPWRNHFTNLRWDTPTGNYSDRYVHGTHAHGERNHRARLTFEDVLRIRERALFGAYTNETAQLFNIDHATVADIVKRRTWVTL
jgi:hypothetical protein